MSYPLPEASSMESQKQMLSASGLLRSVVPHRFFDGGFRYPGMDMFRQNLSSKTFETVPFTSGSPRHLQGGGGGIGLMHVGHVMFAGNVPFGAEHANSNLLLVPLTWYQWLTQ
jgi:hypothetical protein